MKISRLFHWLYAFLMALPIFAILSVVLINTFNKEREYTREEVEITYKYETNEVTSYDDIKVGNIYTFTGYFNDYQYIGECKYFSYKDVNFSVVDFVGSDDVFFNVYFADNLIYANYTINGTASHYYGMPIDENCTFDLILNSKSFNRSLANNFSICINIPIDSYEFVDVGVNTEDSFYYAIDKVENSPLFSWAKTSFLVTPFSFIVGLFGINANSPIVLFLSYWLSISIIWLVFDLIMYVPLLVHRWIDKGMVE